MPVPFIDLKRLVSRVRADVLPALLPLLAGEEAEQRTYAALTVGLLGDPRAVAPLLGMLREWLDIGGQYYNDPFAVPLP